MSRTTDREDFIARMAKAGVPAKTARDLLRLGRTLTDLAVKECNGDWPADHGGEWPTEPCARCESRWSPQAMQRLLTAKALARKGGMARAIFEGLAIVDCPSPGFHNVSPAYLCPRCVAVAKAQFICQPWGIEPHTHGDPRGCVLKLRVPGDPGNDFGGEGLVCVP